MGPPDASRPSTRRRRAAATEEERREGGRRREVRRYRWEERNDWQLGLVDAGGSIRSDSSWTTDKRKLRGVADCGSRCMRRDSSTE